MHISFYYYYYSGLFSFSSSDISSDNSSFSTYSSDSSIEFSAFNILVFSLHKVTMSELRSDIFSGLYNTNI